MRHTEVSPRTERSRSRHQGIAEPADTYWMQLPEHRATLHAPAPRTVLAGLVSLTIIALVLIRFSATVYNAGQVLGFFYLALTFHA